MREATPRRSHQPRVEAPTARSVVSHHPSPPVLLNPSRPCLNWSTAMQPAGPRASVPVRIVWHGGNVVAVSSHRRQTRSLATHRLPVTFGPEHQILNLVLCRGRKFNLSANGGLHTPSAAMPAANREPDPPLAATSSPPSLGPRRGGSAWLAVGLDTSGVPSAGRRWLGLRVWVVRPVRRSW
jgi:hypothetical protein